MSCFGGDADGDPVEFDDQHDEAEVRRHSAITAIAGMAVYGSALVTSPLTARALGPGGRGDLTAVVGPTQVYLWIMTFGLPMAALYFASKYPPRKLLMGAWAWGLAAGTLFAAIVWKYVPIYLHHHDPETVFWFRAFVVAAIPFVPCYVSLDLLLARRRVVAYNLLRLIPYAINLVALVVLAILGQLDLRNALAASFGSHVIWFVIVFTVCGTWPGRGFDRQVFARQIQYGARVAPGTLSEFVVARLDQLVLVGMVTSASLGRYAVAVNVAGVSQPIAYGIVSTVFPRIRTTKDVESGKELNRIALRYAWIASLAISGLIAVATPLVIPWVFGDDFQGAVVLVLLLLPGQVAQNIGIVLAGRLQAVGRPGRASQGQLLAAAVTGAGLWFFIGSFGIAAAAVVTSVSQLTYLAYIWWSVRSAPHIELSPEELAEAAQATSAAGSEVAEEEAEVALAPLREGRSVD